MHQTETQDQVYINEQAAVSTSLIIECPLVNYLNRPGKLVSIMQGGDHIAAALQGKV